MMAWLLLLIPLLPALSALVIGILSLADYRDEKLVGRLAWLGAAGATLLAMGLFLFLLTTSTPASEQLIATWLSSGSLSVDLSLRLHGFNLGLASLFALIQCLVTRFSINYLHREIGFARFFFFLSLFASSMMLLVLAGNALFTFIGWELAGFCSFALIGFAYDRPIAVQNAVRVFVTNRIGDVAFLLAIVLSLLWLESADWAMINNNGAELAPGDASLLALCFTLAAFAKSAQIPFTPWLTRAMEGPTPSTAVFYGGVMTHAGVFLLIQLRPLLEQTPLVMSFVAVIGGLTALYAYWVGLSQTDIKSSHIFAASLQLGLMFFECGLGWWGLATWHLAGHAVLRCYLLLTAPSILHATHGQSVAPVTPWLRDCRWAFMASLQRFWLEPAMDRLLVKPVKQLARDARYLEEHVIEPLLGSPAPAIRAISSLAQWEERKMGANLESSEDCFAQGSGLAGKLAQWTAALSGWFEYHFILRGIGRDTIHWGRKLGRVANRFEQLLLKPRYLLLFVIIVLLVALNP